MTTPDHCEGAIEVPLIEIRSPSSEITLRQFSLTDVSAIFQLIDSSRTHLSQHGDTTADKYKTPEDVAESISNPKNPKRLRFGIYNKAGELVGSINLTPKNTGPLMGEIGYYLGEDATGYGYATEAVITLTDYAFNDLSYASIYAVVSVANSPSAKVLGRAGYRYANDPDIAGELIFERFKPKE